MRQRTEFFAIVATTIAGCAAAPIAVESDKEPNEATTAEGSVAADTGVIEEHLSDADTETKVGCRKEITTGTRVKRLTCKPAKDDTDLIPLISAPRH